MDIPAVGSHCALSSCNVNDFLPIQCQCGHLYCKDHISPDSHSCTASNSNRTDLSHRLSDTLQRCAFVTCKRPSLEAFVAESTRADAKGRTPALCPRCKRAFCAMHREPQTHACVSPAPSSLSGTKNDAAHALLAKHFPSASSSSAASSIRSSKPSINPKRVAQVRQVQLMKMRHRAQPGDPRDKGKPVPLDQKIHVQVHIEGDDTGNSTSFWFRKTIVTGKALDYLASHYGLSSETTPIYLIKVAGDDRASLRNDVFFGEQVEDGSELLLSQ